MLARCLAVAVLTLLCAAQAQAAVTVKVSIVSKRLVVVVKGAKPKAVSVVAGGKSYALSRSGSKWRSKVLPGADALAGTTVKVKVRSASGTKTLSAKLPGGASKEPAPPTPTPTPAPTPVPTPAPTPAGPQPLFPAPAAPSTGIAAFDAIKGFIADSRFTDCPASWPNCAVEQRYSHFADGTQYYCRLTPTSGSDIRSVGTISQVSGAEYNADGSWGFEYYLSSYGNTVFYSWSVSPYGVVTGRYWGPGRDPSSGAPNEGIGPLQYVRGAKDCSY